MASTLSDRLSRLGHTMRGQSRITEDNVQDMLRGAHGAARRLTWPCRWCATSSSASGKALGQEVVGSLSPRSGARGRGPQKSYATMGEGISDLNLATQPPAVILMAGLQGAGKTTTTAKLAKHLIEKRKEEGADGLCRRVPPRGPNSSRPSRPLSAPSGSAPRPTRSPATSPWPRSTMPASTTSTC